MSTKKGKAVEVWDAGDGYGDRAQFHVLCPRLVALQSNYALLN